MGAAFEGGDVNPGGGVDLVACAVLAALFEDEGYGGSMSFEQVLEQRNEVVSHLSGHDLVNHGLEKHYGGCDGSHGCEN